ncbi:cysteine desulfurase family protein [Enterococcus columbae]|uniref:cysteine desulfurase n=1 Tax=Enterococcus columbae DSM 7374 = ATCC 51263 TaxID=1121865 RepID=S0KL25_9ENTE|nr:cysteine desulfurase family protein [Enterococcus columbae]EOT39906.1 cysteine desulfurase [Enterococcus columbae DSM 7374 = ATCC 51263]EOW83891.1 cysteine desulfurase [Enterococcus columbae DSM 7374 = ATCC 51263]OJG20545.1 cysteine desulfurase [Enterococcus columbae DSM 7374 = ATCC 51263]
MYFDHAATTPMHPLAIEEMAKVMANNFGNPSSIHSYGRHAHAKLSEARQKIAQTLGVAASEIIFTSGGTEGDNTAIIGCAWANQDKGKHIITTAIEHPAVLESMHFLEAQGFEVTYLPVDHEGMLDVEDVKSALREDTILVSIMFANNETGNLLPIAEIGALLADHPAVFHTDAVQAYGKVFIEPKALGVDLLSISAHKINGPKGVGFLYKDTKVKLASYLHGGEQEEKRRAGTENLPAICAMAKMATYHHQALLQAEQLPYHEWTEYLVAKLEQEKVDFKINGQLTSKLPHVLNLSFPGVDNQLLLMRLDLKHMAISTGSACTAGNVHPSHVLTAMYGEDSAYIRSGIRLSFGYGNTFEQIQAFTEELLAILHQLQA